MILVAAWTALLGLPISTIQYVSAWIVSSERGFRIRPLWIYQKGQDDIQPPASQSTFSKNSTRLYYRNDDYGGLELSAEGENGEEARTIEPDPTLSSSTYSSTSAATGTLGDIMSNPHHNQHNKGTNILSDGLVTSESSSLCKAYGIDNPLDRIAVTANGNLQRLFASYYDTPVRVRVEKCQRRPRRRQCEEMGLKEVGDDTTLTAATAAIWDRQVSLTIFDDHVNNSDNNKNGQSTSENDSRPTPTVLCTASSVIYVHDAKVEALVESGSVGIGQLFRHFNILPDFHLVEAGKYDTEEAGNNQGFWRRYQLTSDLVTCDIREVFCPNLWELAPPTPKGD